MNASVRQTKTSNGSSLFVSKIFEPGRLTGSPLKLAQQLGRFAKDAVPFVRLVVGDLLQLVGGSMNEHETSGRGIEICGSSRNR